jgi:nucleoside-diphosphate-sugar epimerase
LDSKIRDRIIGPESQILVTGASGFVGSMVVHTLLAMGYKQVRALVRSPDKRKKLEGKIKELGQGSIEILCGNLLSHETCRQAVNGVSVIYHLAAGVGKSFPGCFLDSAVATRNLLDAAITDTALLRFVNTSSIAVYSNEKIPRGGLLDESSDIERHIEERCEAYTYGKLKQDEVLLDYVARYHVPHVIVRPSVVFGPGRAKIADRIGSDTFGVFLHRGLGNRIPLTYIDNCAEAIVLAGLIKGIEGQVFNITDDDLPTSREFLRLYKRHVRRFFSIPVPYGIWLVFCTLWERYSLWSGGQLPPVFNRRGCAIYWKGNIYSNRKAKEMLGWIPRIPMEEGLRRFFAYMRETEEKKR